MSDTIYCWAVRVGFCARSSTDQNKSLIPFQERFDARRLSLNSSEFKKDKKDFIFLDFLRANEELDWPQERNGIFTESIVFSKGDSKEKLRAVWLRAIIAKFEHMNNLDWVFKEVDLKSWHKAVTKLRIFAKKHANKYPEHWI